MASVLHHIGRLTIHHLFRQKLLSKSLPFLLIKTDIRSSLRTTTLPWVQEQEINANTVDKLLSYAEKIDMEGKHAIYILQQLNKWIEDGQTNLDEFSNDIRFLTVCDTLRKDCQRMTHSSVLFALRNLLEIGMPPESEVVRFYENEVLWKARKMNLKALITCLTFQKHYQHTELQISVLKEIIQIIQKRWFEIVDASDVIRLLHHSDLFDEDFLSKVEDRLLELMKDMNIVELHKVLLCFSQLNRRATPILKAISYHINQRSNKLDIKQLINTLFALNVLTFPDSVLLEKLSSDLLTEIPKISKPQLMSTLLISIGQLSWRDKNLLEACSEWLMKNIDICRSQELAAYIITLAKVNYYPTEIDKIFQLILSQFSEKNIENKKVWLDIVWSLAILKKATADHLATVLKPSFYQSLIESDSYHSNISKLKLLNIQSVAVIEHPLNPMLVGVDKHKFDYKQTKKDDEKQLSKSVLLALSDFIPVGKYMVVYQDTSMGNFIDAEFIVDVNGKPQAIEMYGVRSGLSNICKPLPDNFFRIALITWDFKDFTLDNQELKGINALYVRLLKKIGYSVVEIPHTEYSDKLTPVKKVQYLQKKILQTIQKK